MNKDKYLWNAIIECKGCGYKPPGWYLLETPGEGEKEKKEWKEWIAKWEVVIGGMTFCPDCAENLQLHFNQTKDVDKQDA